MNDLFSVGDDIEYGNGFQARVTACNGNRVILSDLAMNSNCNPVILFAEAVFEGTDGDFYFVDEADPWKTSEDFWSNR